MDQVWGELKDRQVLEVGCGAGRFTELLLAEGACVTSIDLSDAVETNQENCPQGAWHRIAQADATCLPLRGRQFRVVVALGMVQHTPNPEETIRALAEEVSPGGWLVLDHYTRNLSWQLRTAPLLRQVLRRLAPEQGLRSTERLVMLLFPLHRAMRKWRIADALLTRLSPVTSYYHSYPELSDALQYEWALLDTHDSLTDWYKHFRSTAQIRRAIERAGLKVVRCEYAGNGVEAVAQRLSVPAT